MPQHDDLFTPTARARLAKHLGWDISPSGKFCSKEGSPCLGEPPGTEFEDEWVWYVLIQTLRHSGGCLPKLDPHAFGRLACLGTGTVEYVVSSDGMPATDPAIVTRYKEVMQALESENWRL